MLCIELISTSSSVVVILALQAIPCSFALVMTDYTLMRLFLYEHILAKEMAIASTSTQHISNKILESGSRGGVKHCHTLIQTYIVTDHYNVFVRFRLGPRLLHIRFTFAIDRKLFFQLIRYIPILQERFLCS